MKSLWNKVRVKIFAFKVWMFFAFTKCNYFLDFGIGIVLILIGGVTFLGKDPNIKINFLLLRIALASIVAMEIYRYIATIIHGAFLSDKLKQHKDLTICGLSDLSINNGVTSVRLSDLQEYILVTTLLTILLGSYALYNVDMLYSESVFDTEKRSLARFAHDMFFFCYLSIVSPYNYFYHFMLKLSRMKS